LALTKAQSEKRKVKSAKRKAQSAKRKRVLTPLMYTYQYFHLANVLALCCQQC